MVKFRWFAKEYPEPPAMLFKFVPKDDITTQELAYLVSRFCGTSAPRHGVHFTQDQWQYLPDNIKRHFQ